MKFILKRRPPLTPASCPPPALDLMRLLVLNPFAAKYYSSPSSEDPVLAVAALLSGKAGGDLPMPTWLMALRLLVNCFRQSEMRKKITEHCSTVIDSCKGAAGKSPSPLTTFLLRRHIGRRASKTLTGIACSCPGVRNANVEVAYATLLMDYAVLIREVGHSKVRVFRPPSGPLPLLRHLAAVDFQGSTPASLCCVRRASSLTHITAPRLAKDMQPRSHRAGSSWVWSRILQQLTASSAPPGLWWLRMLREQRLQRPPVSALLLEGSSEGLEQTARLPKAQSS